MSGTAEVGGQSNGCTAMHGQSVAEDQTAGDAVAQGRLDQVTTTGSALSEAEMFSRYVRLSPENEASSPRDHPTESEDIGQAPVDLNDDFTTNVARSKLLCSLTAHAPNLLSPTSAREVMETIFLNCANLNYARGKYNDRDAMVPVKTNIEEIRSHAEQIAEFGYVQAVDAVKKELSIGASRNIQARYNEAFYWEIITKGAKLLDPAKLPPTKGPLDEFTKAEKVAAAKFMIEAGHGTSYTSQQRFRRLWKSLFDMRKAGVDKILFYRTKQFDKFCEAYPRDGDESLVDTVLSWDKVYGPHIGQLEGRVTEESGGDLTGKSWLSQPYVAERLEVPEALWDCAKNLWISEGEEAAFKSASGFKEASGDQLGGLFDIHVASGYRCKSTFVSLLPWNETSLRVCPTVTVREGDFLGVFAGKIRFSEEFDATWGIRGPREKLWLDCSQDIGLLNLMRVSPPDGYANVRLQWELVYDLKGSPAWRVSVRALKTIEPFEEIIRVASQTEQYDMHQAFENAGKVLDLSSSSSLLHGV
ncbi:hypothetical protein VFPPC_11486 [Pochonia chlamydosporia 170]|uniref:Uncharacterized protein n=1 Tax=Pochonia chlamydosporia 170 TaxID=1380566 RepID=A0A179F0R2_METCM|nr:hypothetical protein VFPPC_11486 [Pochonia chlamydosporia 170]OAQ58992.1 hypothetical protein VFPPC_11486 [Pochonia chlamydosporia 170]